MKRYWTPYGNHPSEVDYPYHHKSKEEIDRLMKEEEKEYLEKKIPTVLFMATLTMAVMYAGLSPSCSTPQEPETPVIEELGHTEPAYRGLEEFLV